MAFQNVGSAAAIYVAASPGDRKKITNLGGGTLYYGDQFVSSGDNDGEVAADASLEIADGVYVIAATGGTGLHIEDQGDVRVVDDLEVADDLTVSSDLAVTGNAAVTGELTVSGAVPIRLANDVVIFSTATAPVNGTTLDNVAGKGSLCVALDTGKWYTNTGTLASSTWTVVGAQS